MIYKPWREKKTQTNKQENLKYHCFLQPHLEAVILQNRLFQLLRKPAQAFSNCKNIQVKGKLFLEISCLLVIVLNAAK